MTIKVGTTTWDVAQGFLQHAQQTHREFTRDGIQDIVVLYGARRGSVQEYMTQRTVADRAAAIKQCTDSRRLTKTSVNITDQHTRQFPKTVVLNAVASFVETLDGYLVRCSWRLLVQANDVDPQSESPLAP